MARAHNTAAATTVGRRTTVILPPPSRTSNPMGGRGWWRTYARRGPSSRQGFLCGGAGYAMWDAFPLYWPLLEPAGSVEILSHRILWSLVTMTVLLVVL